MELMIDPDLCQDLTPAAWVSGRLEYGGTVRAWIPDGFERYARVLHPAIRTEDNHPVPWSELAAWSGKPLRRGSFILDLDQRPDGTTWSGIRGSLPEEGQLVRPLFDRLLDILAPVTSTPQDLWLLVWFGHGVVPQGRRTPATDISPSLRGSGRRYFLFHGSIANSEAPPPTGVERAFREPPSFWWPADKAWFVSTDIDQSSTYVGGSGQLVDRLLSDGLLEVVPAELDDTIDGSPYWARKAQGAGA